jgi:putative transcriptional regulator
MPIVVNLDIMLVRRKVKSIELARAIGISETNLSLLKAGRVKGVRFGTLEAICQYLDCQPGDLLEYRLGASQEKPNSVADERLRKPPWR